jgi:hypothetical protein
MKTYLLPLLGALFFAANTYAQDDDQFIKVLQQIVVDRTNHFANVRGTSDGQNVGGAPMWNLTVALPGAKDGDVVKQLDGDHFYVDYLFPAEVGKDPDAAKASFQRLKGLIEKSIPKDWTSQAGTLGKDDSGWMIMFGPDKERYVELEGSLVVGLFQPEITIYDKNRADLLNAN